MTGWLRYETVTPFHPGVTAYLEVNKMGWKGYESTISLGMIFKKMYCKKCGSILKKKKIGTIYKKGEPNYSNDILGQATIGMDRIERAYYIYY